MLKKLNAMIDKIVLESTMAKYLYADELIEDAYDKIGFESFSDLLENKEFIEKVNNTNKSVLEDAKNSLWENIENYDNDNEKAKNEALKFYNYLKEIILKKA